LEAYSAFHNYSIGNQLLALMQCHIRGLTPGPIRTFPGWQALGRNVRRGERALLLCMPITGKRREADAEDEAATYTAFVYKPRWFVLTQTEGEEMPATSIPEYNTERALAALNIERIPFDLTDGNCQGYARLCGRQHKQAYVAKSVMWRRVMLASKDWVSSACTPHKFSSL
ncbi:MAG: hypothetical protein H0T92_03775, partial [Pyrinomonadaceae bacterium]|nr:hypothetical protein [Pyrinomonadaceae bacterium]